MAAAADIRAEFSSIGYEIDDDDVLDKCAWASAGRPGAVRAADRAASGVELCTSLGKSADELAIEWEAYAVRIDAKSVTRADLMRLGADMEVGHRCGGTPLARRAQCPLARSGR